MWNMRMPGIIIDDGFVEMTSGHALSCELYCRNSGHIRHLLGAIQCGNPEPEIFCYAQTARIHGVEQRRKVTAITVDNSRISRVEFVPPLSPLGTQLRIPRVTFLEIEHTRLIGVTPEDVD